MNNIQFVFIVTLISFASGLIGYGIGGVLLGIIAFTGVAGVFLCIGD